jgi:hypothetical protein
MMECKGPQDYSFASLSRQILNLASCRATACELQQSVKL